MTQGQYAHERRPPWAAFIIAAGLAALGAVLLWDAAGLKQDGGYAGVGPADVPRMVAFVLIGLSAWTVLAGLKGDVETPPRQDIAPIIWIIAGLGLQLVLLHLAGFAIAGGLLFGLTARAFGKRNLGLTIGIGIVFALGVYGVFDQLLKLNLPAGPLERAIFGG